MRTLATNWIDYECLDAGNGQKVERWKDIILKRPDPQAVWTFDDKQYKYDAIYHRSNKGGGSWQFNKKLPEFWTINYKDLTFKVSPTNFKHTGIFPEQAVNWDFMMDKIQNCDHEVKVLNLFAYTGCATMACSKAGASEVVHVDASKGMIEWAKQNMQLSHLENNKIRFIVDDVLKFVQREKRRGHKYHGIVMDPPSYGRGPNNELFKFEEKINPLIEAAISILSDKPIFIIINTYTTGYSATVIKQVLKANLEKTAYKYEIVSDEIGIEIQDSGYDLPCGFTTRGIFK